MATPKKESTLHHAIVKVMQEVKNIEKAMTVGSGNYSYKGVSDKDVKQAIGQAMAKNGLTCVPVKIEPTTDINRWEEETNYNGNKQIKQKMSVFVEVLSTFRITHAESKESIDIQGFGQGADTGDKAAGKATTYALKNALLYSFLVPTGAIDDTDNTHSNDMEQAPAPKQVARAPKVKMDDTIYGEALLHVLSGKVTVAQAQKKYDVSADYVAKFEAALKEQAEQKEAEEQAEGAAKMTAKSESIAEPAPEATKEEAKEEKKAPAKKNPAAKKPKKEPAKKEPIEEAEVISDDSENSGLAGFDKVAAKIDEYTSSDQLIKDKKIIELEIKLEQLTEEETADLKKVVNDKYSRLKEANL